MAPPKGNQYAVGHGRPPKPGYSDEECIQLGEDLMEWMDEKDREGKKNVVVHLSQWYSQVKGIPKSQWDSICDRACFHSYYEKAKDWMGVQILKNSTMPSSYGNRFLPIYFRDVDKQEFEVEKKKIDYLEEKKSKSEYNPEAMDQILALMNQISSIQSTRKIDDNSNKAESKS